MLKKNIKTGDIVNFWEPPSFSMSGKVLEVDSHPFEYDMIKVEQLDLPTNEKRIIWISEKNVEKES